MDRTNLCPTLHTTAAASTTPSTSATTSNLRRHKSLTEIRSVRRRSTTTTRAAATALLRRNSTNKLNPYVGTFRHSPPSSSSGSSASSASSTSPKISTISKSSETSSMVVVSSRQCEGKAPRTTHLPLTAASRRRAILSLHHAKKRQQQLLKFQQHAFSVLHGCSRTTPDHYRFLEKELCRLLNEQQQRPKMQDGVYRLTDLLNGRLRGGVRGVEDRRAVESLCRGLSDRSVTANRSSGTVKALTKLVCWFLLPSNDTDQDDEGQFRDYRSCLSSSSSSFSSGSSSDCSCCSSCLENDKGAYGKDDKDDLDSLFSCCDEEEDDYDDYDTICGSRVRADAGEPQQEDRDDTLRQFSRSSSSMMRSSSSLLLPSITAAHQHADFSISSQAEAYYAHQAAKQTEYLDPEGENRLDYDITQMDIVRMARNANRHLDVESIWRLPTITYRSSPPPSPSSSSSCNKQDRQGEGDKIESGSTERGLFQERQDEESWSWLLVQAAASDCPENQERDPGADHTLETTYSSKVQLNGGEEQSEPKQPDDHDVCVICLEHFVDGDRLRVLPCDHSFHVGCIDRWLSGSHSFDECYTAGCPTCKKRAEPSLTTSVPTTSASPSLHVLESDGAVPSWAYANIGDALSRA